MKILFVLEQLNIGGPQKSLLGLLENIDYSKCSIDVLLMQNEGKLLEYLNPEVKLLKAPDIIEAFTFPVKHIKRTLLTFLKFGGLKLFLSGFILLVKHTISNNCMNVQRQKFWKTHKNCLPLLEGEYDIAFGYSPVMSTYYVRDCVNSKKKYHWIRCDYRILNMDREIEKEYFKSLDGVVAVSSMCRDIFVHIFPFTEKHSTYFYNYIPTNFYGKLPTAILPSKEYQNEVRLITVARVEKNKGIDLVVDACALLKNKINFKWIIVGDGPDRKEFEKSVKQKRLDKQLMFIGFQLNVYSCLKQSDIFVLPSRTEGKSNAVDEAKQIGIPIIVTNYPTVSEQITNEQTGLVCQMSSESLCKAVLRIVNDSDLKKKMAINCRIESKKHEMPNHLFARLD